MIRSEVFLSDYDDVNHIDEMLGRVDWTKFKDKRILVTGSNGMLGICFTSLLIRAYSINILEFQSLTLASRKWIESYLDGIVDEKISYLSNEDAQTNATSYDVIFHLASPSNISKIESLQETLNINLLVGFNLENVSQLIYISSGEVYLGGDTSKKPRIQNFKLNDLRGIYPYSKFKAEEYFSGIASKQGTELTIIRLFHTFGPGISRNDGRSFADFIWNAARKQNIVMNSNGDQVRSFLYIVDACLGIIHAAIQQGSEKVFNLGSVEPVSILEFAQRVAARAGVEVENNSQESVLPQSPFRKIVPDLEKLSNTGWNPKYDLNFAIEKTLSWAATNLKN